MLGFLKNFSKINSHLILLLLRLEFIYLLDLLLLRLNLNYILININIVLIIMVFIVREACVGLRLIVLLRRLISNELETSTFIL